MSPQQEIELFKSSLSLGISLLTIVLGWLVGHRLTARWNLRQKHREFDLAASNDFHRLYGEFFAIWKLWNYVLTPESGCTVPRSDLLVRACAAEGAIESLLVRLAASRNFSEANINDMGRFRQAYQRLREVIRDNQKLDWNSSSHPEYLTFKKLATAVAFLMASDDPALEGGTVRKRAEALVSITSAQWENNWVSK